MATTRPQTCSSTSAKLAAADVSKVRAVVGLDGFVDEIIEVVDQRSSASQYTRIPTIAAFGAKITAAAGQSTNFELVVTQQKLGGNGPIMANALASIGLAVTYVGNLGFPAIHPVFAPMAQRSEVISIADAGHTDALEFHDGKLMLGKHASLRDVNWDNLLAHVGLEKLTARIDAANLVGMVNWTMLPHMTNIWEHLLSDIMPKLSKKNRVFFFDLADPEKRPVDDLRTALQTIARFQAHVQVILGLNLSESNQVAAALGIAVPADAEAAIEQTAAAIRAKLDLATVVIHPRKAAAAANKISSATFAGPFVAQPKISTGAGDHFNAGFATGQLLGLDLAESLCCGTATSGYYVRNAISPSIAQLAEFTKNLPAAQAE